VVISSTIINQRRKTVVVVPLTTAPQSIPPLLVPVRCGGRDVVAVIDQVRAVSKLRLDQCLGELSPEHLKAVEQALREVLELD
jgi:mRNA interferase MazF